MIELVWEELERITYTDGREMVLESASTPGGWMYRSIILDDGYPVSVSLAWAPAVRAGTKQAKAHSWKRKPAPAAADHGLDEEAF